MNADIAKLKLTVWCGGNQYLKSMIQNEAFFKDFSYPIPSSLSQSFCISLEPFLIKFKLWLNNSELRKNHWSLCKYLC